MKFQNYQTNIEKIIFDLLKENNLPFVFQYPIRCKYGYIADFYLPEHNLIIEADGERWHNSKRDNAKTHVLIKLGYRVLRFKGNDIISNPHACLLDIKNKCKEVI